jgi:hypothetical protein
MDSRSNKNFDLTRAAMMGSAKRGNAAHTLGVFEGAPGILEREHWEFSFDSRPTNLTWSWRQVGEKGRTVLKSAAFADLKRAVDDAVSGGFSPGAGNWVVRGVPVTMRAALRRTLSG